MELCLVCPCGEQFFGRDEDDLVAQVQAHLAEKGDPVPRLLNRPGLDMVARLHRVGAERI
jgi:hypothetical protein